MRHDEHPQLAFSASDAQSRRKRLQKTSIRKTVAAIAAVVAITGGLATQLESISTFSERILGYVRSLAYPIRDNPFSYTRDRVELGNDFAIPPVDVQKDPLFALDVKDYNRKRMYLLRIDIRVSFNDMQFNTQDYLQSVSRVEIVRPPHDVGDIYIVSKGLSTNYDYVDTILVQPGSRVIAIRLYIKSVSNPANTEELVLRTGPREWKLPLRNIIWAKYFGRDSDASGARYEWWGGHMAFKLTMDSPSWCLIRSARLLFSRDSDETILEAVIENRSSVPQSLYEMTIAVTEQKTFACSSGESRGIPEWQEVNIEWPLVIDGAPPSNNISWTTIKEQSYQVTGRVMPETCFRHGKGEFYVPLQVDIPPNELRRLLFKLKHLLRERSMVQITVKPDDAIYPSNIVVLDQVSASGEK